MKIIGLIGLFRMIFAAGILSFSENRSKLTVSAVLILGLCTVIIAVKSLT